MSWFSKITGSSSDADETLDLFSENVASIKRRYYEKEIEVEEGEDGIVNMTVASVSKWGLNGTLVIATTEGYVDMVQWEYEGALPGDRAVELVKAIETDSKQTFEDGETQWFTTGGMCKVVVEWDKDNETGKVYFQETAL